MNIQILPHIQKNISFLLETVSYLYAFLYMYTGYGKLMEVDVFIQGIHSIPYIGRFAELIGWGIPLSEILLAIALFIPSLQRAALYVSTLLMGVFTLYLAVMLIFAEEKMCHCGGVIESLGWTEHLIFNLILLTAGIWALIQTKIKK